MAYALQSSPKEPDSHHFKALPLYRIALCKPPGQLPTLYLEDYAHAAVLLGRQVCRRAVVVTQPTCAATPRK